MKKKSKQIGARRKKRVLKDEPVSSAINRNKMQKKRLCLKCGKKFPSKGPYNRICEKCSFINERMKVSAYSVSSGISEEKNIIEENLYEFN